MLLVGITRVTSLVTTRIPLKMVSTSYYLGSLNPHTSQGYTTDVGYMHCDKLPP